MVTEKPGPNELLSALTPNVAGECPLVREAYEHGRTLQHHLDEVMEESDYKDGLSGLERMLKAADVRVSSDFPKGVYCHTIERFEKLGATGSALMLEWAAAIQRRARFGLFRRDIGGSDEVAPNTSLRPYMQIAARRPVIEPAIPLSTVIALTVPITGDSIRQILLTHSDAEDTERRRVPQGTPIPLATIMTSEKTGRIYKYGIGIEFTYEALRRVPIDQFGYFLEQETLATELTQLADAVAMMIAGDGEVGSAATVYNLTTLDPSTTANNLTLKAYISFKLKFGDSFNLTTMLAREDNALALNLLQMGTANHMFFDSGAAAGFGTIRPINKSLRDGVGLGITDEAPAARIIGFDANRALMRVVENGSDITEFESFVRRQTRAVYFSNVEGYQVLTPGAVKILRTDA